MKIPNELTPVAYRISKQIFEGALTFKEGKRQLVGEERINPNSAADYIHNFRCMIEGKKFTRTNNAHSMEYFFDNIYIDYGSEKLSNALKALDLHIEYYEGIQKIKMHKMRAIYSKYLAYPIDTPDEQEQKQIINELSKQSKTKKEIIDELKNLKPTDSVETIINSKSFKRDSKTIAQLKIIRDFKCQICSTTIKKKNGTFYIEAAHIDPKHNGGCETPYNILILCPNHHKEFDFGNLHIVSRDRAIIKFTLNEFNYEISLKLD